MKAYVFPGQGSQYRGMGADLFGQYGDMVKQADGILGYSIEELCLEDPKRQLDFTWYTQPALYVVNAMSYKHQIEKDSRLPDYLAGHSLGEYNALQASGAVSFEDGLRLVQKRGQLMSQAPKGAMAAVLGPTDAEIKELLISSGLSTIDIANCNSLDQTVISGLEDDLAKAETVFGQRDIKFIPLNTSGAFHSRYMDTAANEFNKFIRQFNFSVPKIDVISNVDARPYTQAQIVENLTSQITRSVKWLESIRYMMDAGVTEFREIGVGNVLTTLIEKIQTQLNQRRTELVDEPVKVCNDITDDGADEQQDMAQTAKTIDAWNAAYPIGTRVLVKNHNDVFETRTKAMLLFDRKATIYMEGYKGYFDLIDVQPVAD